MCKIHIEGHLNVDIESTKMQRKQLTDVPSASRWRENADIPIHT